MRALVRVVKLVLGTAYTGYGVMTAVELKREWRTLGFSRFGAAWIFMAFTLRPPPPGAGRPRRVRGPPE